MKQHLLITFHAPLALDKVPYWEDFIRDKSIVHERFRNDLDSVFIQYDIPIWITGEFQPANDLAGFSPEETRSGLDKIYRVIFQDSRPVPPGLLAEIRQSALVKNVRAISIGAAAMPSVAQSVRDKYDEARAAIFLPRAHLFSKGHPGIKIAVLDTGIDPDHLEFRGKKIEMADFVNLEGLDTSEFVGDTLGYDQSPLDEVGHGCHVAGIVSAKGVKMPSGIAPECSLMVVRVLATMEKDGRKFGAGLIDNINTGIKWAVDKGADVINMSLGVRHEHGGLPHQEIVEYALRKGVTIVAASGNDGTNDKYYPGALPGVIAVASVNNQNQSSRFSSFGQHVGISAPGDDIFSAFVNNSYAMASGTSQASPFVTGGVALLKSLALQHGRRLSDTQVKNILRSTSDRSTARVRTEKEGYGRINLADALKLLMKSLNN